MDVARARLKVTADLVVHQLYAQGDVAFAYLEPTTGQSQFVGFVQRSGEWWAVWNESPGPNLALQAKAAIPQASSQLISQVDWASTASDAGAVWRKSTVTMRKLAALIKTRLTDPITVYLPTSLPKGWAVAAEGQEFPEEWTAWGDYPLENPSVSSKDGSGWSQYQLLFTDGNDLVVLGVHIGGDWGDSVTLEQTVWDDVPLWTVSEGEDLLVMREPYGDTVVKGPGR